MLFNSVHFFYFFPIVVILYFFTKQKWSWLILLVASYYFYMSWNVDFVLLISLTTLISYVSALYIEKSKKKAIKKIFLWLSISTSLGALFFFKYFNFFGDLVNQINQYFGFDMHVSSLSYLLPVGISFYTFQTLSYTIDVYKGEVKTEKHLGIYALYVSFFPQLVAGPIERSSRLLPQFRIQQKLKSENFIKGLKWIIYGFFLKLVIADRLSIYVDSVYNNVDHHSGFTFVIATILFAFQIFGDFAGYSSIAIGSAKIIGIDLMVNFQRPYFASSIGDFWHRWHISLSTWFRDYFYIPLGGNRVSIPRWYLNIFLTFLVSGFWHGANWTFIAWGALHGFYMMIENMFKLSLGKKKQNLVITRIARAFVVFGLVNIAWIFFRANSISDAFKIIVSIINFDNSVFVDYDVFFYGIIGLIIMFVSDLIIEKNENSILINSKINLASVIYFSFLIALILFIGVFNGGQFIYFQF